MKTIDWWIKLFKEYLTDKMSWEDNDPEDIPFTMDRTFLEKEFKIKLDGLKFINLGEDGPDIKIIEEPLPKGVRYTRDPIIFLAINNGYELKRHISSGIYLNCPYGIEVDEVILLKNTDGDVIIKWGDPYSYNSYAFTEKFVELIIENAANIANLSWKNWETGERYDQDGNLVI